MDTQGSGAARGRIAAVRGNVVDVVCDGAPPPRNRALRTGKDREVVLEVQTHVDAHTARCIALTPTRGLRRGDAVDDSGDVLRVPVGRPLLGRALDVFGRTAERRAERALVGEYRECIEELLRTLSAANLVQAVAIARIPEEIRGFGHVKDASLKAARTKWAGLMAAWRGGGERRAA